VLARALLARKINQACGGAVLRPWEVDELPDEWIEGLTALVTDLAQAESGAAQLRAYMDNWLASHPRYRGEGRG